jgi:hypothetical protein
MLAVIAGRSSGGGKGRRLRFWKLCSFEQFRLCTPPYDYTFLNKLLVATTELRGTTGSAVTSSIDSTMRPLVCRGLARSEFMKSYDTCGNAAKEVALKVVVTNGASR